jgi:hypothetical protein
MKKYTPTITSGKKYSKLQPLAVKGSVMMAGKLPTRISRTHITARPESAGKKLKKLPRVSSTVTLIIDLRRVG